MPARHSGKTHRNMRVCSQRDLEHESVFPGHIDDGEDWQNHLRVGPIAKATISWFTRQYNWQIYDNIYINDSWGWFINELMSRGPTFHNIIVCPD